MFTTSRTGTIAYHVTPNPLHVARTATIKVALSTITITQDAAPCQYGVSPLKSSAWHWTQCSA